MDDKSPPNAPKAPLIALKRAVPVKFYCEYRKASDIYSDFIVLNVIPARNKKMYFFIFK